MLPRALRIVTAGVLYAVTATAATVDTTGGATLNTDNPANTYIGNGTLTVANDGSGLIELATGSGTGTTTFQMAGGSISIDSGVTLRNGGWQKGVWASNLSSLNVVGTFDVWDGQDVNIDALSGSGTILKGNSGNAPNLYIGVNNGSGDFSGVISGNKWTPTKVGTGTQTLSGTTDNGSGNAAISNGVLVLAKTSSSSVHAIGNSLKIYGGTVRLGGSGGDQIWYNASVQVNGGIFDLNGNNEGVGQFTLYNGTVMGAGTLTCGGSTIDVRTGMVSSALAGSVGLTKTTAGTVTLSATNTFTGAITVSEGVLELTGDAIGGFQTSATIAPGALLKLNGITNGTHSGNNITAANLAAVGHWSATRTFSGSGTLAITNAVALGNSSAAATINVALGSGGLIDIQSGFLANGGWSKAMWTNNLGDMAIAAGAEFDIWDGTGVYIDALTGSGNVVKNNGDETKTLTIGVDNGSGMFAGGISGTSSRIIALVKAGTGTQTLTGTNTYYGATTISNGTLVVGGAGRLGNGSYAGAITNNGLLVYGSTADQALSGVISGSGSLVKSNAASMLTLAGANTYSGVTTVSNGTLLVSGSVASPVTVVPGAVLAGSGVISNSLTLLPGGSVISLTNGMIGTLTVVNGITLDSGNVLNFDVGAMADKIAITGGAYTKNEGTVTINISTNAGFAVGTYDLITTSGGITSTNGFVLGTSRGLAGKVLALAASGGNLQLVVTTQTAAWWRGDVNGLWNTTAPGYNWDVDQASAIDAGQYPNSSLDVHFSANGAGNLSTTLGQNFTINSLTFDSPSAVTVGGANTLTVNAGIVNGVSAGANVVSVDTLALGAAQTWDNGSANALTVSSAVTGSGRLTKTGVGSLLVSGNNSGRSGDTDLKAGTLMLGSVTAAGAGRVTITPGNDATPVLELNGQTIANAVDLYTNGMNSAAIIRNNSATPASVTGDFRIYGGDATSTQIVFTGSGDITIGNIDGQSSYRQLYKTGSGTLTLATPEDNWFLHTRVDEGTLVLAQQAVGAKCTHNVTVGSAGTLRLGSAGGSQQNIADGNSVTVNSGGVFDLNGYNETVSGVTIGGAGTGSGALINNNGATTATLTGGIMLTAATTIGGSANVTLASAVGGSGFALTKVGIGVLVLSNATYSGGTTVSNGTLMLVNNKTGNSNFTLANSATVEFRLTSANQTLNGGSISGTGNLVKSGANSLLLGGSGSPQTIALTGGSSLIDVQGGTLRNDYGNTAWGGNLAGLRVVSGATFDLWDGAATVDELTGAGTVTHTSYGGAQTLTIGSNNGSGTFSGTITEQGSGKTLVLVKTGSGIQVLTGTNTYSGATTISGGTLEIGGSGTMGGGNYAGAIANSGTFYFNSTSNQILSGAISGTGALVKGGVSALVLSNATYNGGTTVSNGMFTLVNTKTGSGNFSLVNGSIMEFNVTTGSQQLNGGSVSGSGSLIKSGSGTLMFGASGSPETISLAGASSLIDVQGGTLRNEYGNTTWGSNLAGLRVASGATFDIWDGLAVVDALTGAGTINKGWATGANTFTVGINGGSGTFSGSIGNTAGSLSLVKQGSGTQVLAGTNTYSGTTTISAGSLEIGGSGTLGGGSYAATIANSGVLYFNSTSNQTLSGVISGSGALVKGNPASMLTLSGANSFNGATTVSNGTLAVYNTLASSSVTLVQGTVLLATNTTFSGALTILGNASVNMLNGSSGMLTVQNGLTLNDQNVLNFDLGATADKIAVTGGSYTKNAGTVTINITTNSGFTTGTYDLITTSGGITSTNGFVLGTPRAVDGKALTLTASGGNLQLVVATQTAAWWKGDVDGNWNTASPGYNWDIEQNTGVDAGQYPSAGINVHFSADGAGNLNTTLGQDFTANSMTFDTASVVTVGSISNTLTLVAGITNGASAGANVISVSNVVLGTAQTWHNASTNALTVSGAVSGVNPLTKSGTGTLTLSGANTYSGATTISAGRVKLGSATALGTVAGNTTVGSGAALDLNGQTIAEPIGTIIGMGTDGSGALVNSSVGSAAITADISAGGSVFTVGGVGNIDLARVTGSSGITVTKTGGNTMTLSGSSDNAYLAGVVSNGMLVLAKASSGSVHAIGNTLKIHGGMVRLGGSGGDQIYWGYPVEINGGALDLNGNNEGVGQFTLYNGTVMGAGTLTCGGSTIDVRTGIVSSALAGSVGLTKTTVGTVVLSATNTFSGAMTVSEGALELTGDAIGGFQTSATIASGAVLMLNGITGGTHSGSSITAANLAAVGHWSATRTFSGAGTLATTNAVALGNSSQAAVVNMAMGSGGLIDIQSGFLANGGWAKAVWTNNLGDMAIAAGAEFDIWDGNDVYVDALTGSGNVVKNNVNETKTLTIGVDNGSGSFAGGISGTSSRIIALVKAGTGTQTLTGTNTYYGATTISNGTLVVGGAGRLGNGNYAGAITNNGLLIYGSSVDQTLSGVISGSGALVKSNATSMLTLSGVNTCTNDTIVAGGILRLSGGAAIDDRAVLRVGSGATVDVAANEVVNKLYIGGEYKWAGTWGGPASAAPIKDAHFSGTSVVIVTAGCPIGGVYSIR